MSGTHSEIDLNIDSCRRSFELYVRLICTWIEKCTGNTPGMSGVFCCLCNKQSAQEHSRVGFILQTRTTWK